MKHEAILTGEELSPRDPRVDIELPVRVHCDAGDFEAELTNMSSDGFRLHSADPMQVGWEVTLEAATNFPVRALICWACGNESGGVFSEALAL